MALTLATTDTGDTTSIDGTQMQVPSNASLSQPTGTGTFTPFGTDQFGNPNLISLTENAFGGNTLQALAPSTQFKGTASTYNADTAQFGQLAGFFGPFVRNAQDSTITNKNPISNTFQGSFNTLQINAGIDYALPEKQNTFGTPEYFRNLANATQDPGQNAVLNNLAASQLHGGDIAQGLFNTAAQGNFSGARTEAQSLLTLGQATRNVELQNQASSFLNFDFGTTRSPVYSSGHAAPDNPSAQNAAAFNFSPSYLSAQANYNLSRANSPITVTQTSNNSPFSSTAAGYPQYTSAAYGNAAPNFLPGETFLGNGTGSFQSPVFHIGTSYGMNYPNTQTVSF